jgi:hypothetical protein
VILLASTSPSSLHALGSTTTGAHPEKHTHCSFATGNNLLVVGASGRSALYGRLIGSRADPLRVTRGWMMFLQSIFNLDIKKDER